VIHLSSPASVEAYYQEIGRAGRDRQPAQALMLCSYGDRRTHEFFFERDYPHTSELERVFDKLGPEPIFKGSLAGMLKLEDQALDAILDKLWLHGGALIDHEDRITRGSVDFRRTYPKHRASKAAQLAHMARYVHTHECRMLALVRHFGDSDDSGKSCGICDRCQPVVTRSVVLPSTRSASPSRATPRPRARKKSVAPAATHELDAPQKLVDALRAFRSQEAKARSVPAFRVLTDRALYALAHEQPRSEAALLSIDGIGPSLAKKYGSRLLAILRDED
jgi:superfamily II DNA helicase RecQ